MVQFFQNKLYFLILLVFKIFKIILINLIFCGQICHIIAFGYYYQRIYLISIVCRGYFIRFQKFQKKFQRWGLNDFVQKCIFMNFQYLYFIQYCLPPYKFRFRKYIQRFFIFQLIYFNL
ncbi:hypothetical protein IMG5_049250 [Ichthyophthirius multifiliis]|uniref:Transmembrane protein n=1 Tax=Ichthyophthirius multifiliis TaxID=5932 RepID=G0QMI4_ICHMU|nr:hypothetical protein IMG5_049250 [Ichthyophthirius multifiliis]EGR33550.1 hypothetical protein IMG5_049250 [Ichthyophthirius multifiliis]|eukprot:XP_004037536.1 hypothetical protein IMG5_049250 [Ichthyophthirius multifiliis]